jgi:hypothetical protein
LVQTIRLHNTQLVLLSVVKNGALLHALRQSNCATAEAQFETEELFKLSRKPTTAVNVDVTVSPVGTSQTCGQEDWSLTR